MNEADATTTPAGPASVPFDWRAAFDKIEVPIADALSKIEVAYWIAGQTADHQGQNGFCSVSQDEIRVLTFMVFEAHDALKEANRRWSEQHNAYCRLEMQTYFDRSAS